MNRSDCQSWLGSARSKRRSFALGRARGRSRGSAKPSLFSTRRTVVSEAPIPKKRLSTSRMRRLPAWGCARFTSSTASRRASAFATPLSRSGGRASRPCRASRPPARYFLAHSDTVVYGILRSSDTRLTGSFSSTTIAAADTITSAGHARRGACDGASAFLCFD